MASAWGLSWGRHWGNSWGGIDSGVRPSGGIPASLRAWPRTRKQLRKARQLFGIEEEVVLEVAQHQAEDLHLDEVQRHQELRAELALHGIEMRLIHMEALDEIRSALIAEEIRTRLRMRMDDEAILILLS